MNRPYPRRPPPYAATPWRSPRDQLSFRVRRRGDIVLLAVRGQADAFTLDLWRRQVRAAAETVIGPRGALVVDATRLDFLSLRSLTALSDDAREFRRAGIEIYLVTGDPAIARVARADIRNTLLPVRSTVVSALTAVHLRQRTPEVVSESPGTVHAERTRARSGTGVTGRSDFPDTGDAVRLHVHRDHGHRPPLDAAGPPGRALPEFAAGGDDRARPDPNSRPDSSDGDGSRAGGSPG